MKIKFNYLKSMTCILLLLLVMSATSPGAEDYLITFTGSGLSTSVTTVKVENLSQCTSLTMDGTYILHLIATTTGIESAGEDPEHGISFSPNPMTDYSRMEFILPLSGKTLVSLVDLSGREIARSENFLPKGKHTYRLEGIEKGFYFVRINSGRYSAASRLVSSGSRNGDARILYENMTIETEKEGDSKGASAEQVMNIVKGDRLKFTGISGDYSTVVTDIPASSKTITFNFVACTDADQNKYATVKIGAQTWMAENLKTTKFTDGTAIPLVTDSLQWIALTGAGFCWYRNKEVPNKNIYGGLYNWWAASSGKICPTGWRVPTDLEWSAFITYLGTSPSHKLRETCTNHWSAPNSTATNETGFTALPGGWRHSVNYNGRFDGIGTAADWWSSTESTTPNYGIDYYIDNSPYYSGMSKENDSKNVGFSVRCITD